MPREVPPSPSGDCAEAAGGWDARQWLIDNDLWDDNVGMAPEMYDQQPTSTRYRGPR
jgi:hypothetical protein